MKKLFSLAVLAALFVSTVFAQVERNHVLKCAIGDVHYVEPEPKEAPANKTANVVNQVVKGLFSIAAGQDTQTEDRPEFGESVENGLVTAMGAARRVQVLHTAFERGQHNDMVDYYIDATISSIKSTTRTRVWTDKDKKTHSEIEYTANIVGEVAIKWIETGQVVWSMAINSSAWNYSWYNSAEKALGEALASMRYNVWKSLNNSYPLYASIVEGERFTEKKAKEVYIDLGTNFGVSKGMHFFVYSVKEVAGKQAKKKIGQLKVTEVSDEELSLCKVQNGGKEIKVAMEAGETLLIMSKD